MKPDKLKNKRRPVTANRLFTPKYKTNPEIWCNSPKEEGQRPISNMTNKSNDKKSNKSY